MPYIPPPPRPPAPPRPVIPPPRPPAHNFHIQQQQRFHQQQILHQQQRFHQQQLYNQQRLQQQLQMDHARRQQALQQQQQHFQRQQDMFRRQQQEQQRIRQQQQLHQDQLRRQEEQRRQQQLLRNLQHSSAANPVGEIGGTTVVHVAPGIQLEFSSPSINGDAQSRFEANQSPSAPPLLTTGMSPQSYESPPPYQQYPQGISSMGPPPTNVATSPPPTTVYPPSQSTVPQATPPFDVNQTESKVLLNDGTQIIIQQEDEILFVGPTGIQMVVNCLPLYSPPEEAIRASTEDQHSRNDTNDRTPKGSPKHQKSLLRKAKSLTSIAITELELSDEERQSRSDDEILEDTHHKKKKKKARLNSFGAHYSVKVHRQIDPMEAGIEEIDSAPPITHTNREIDQPVKDLSKSLESEKFSEPTSEVIQSSDSTGNQQTITSMSEPHVDAATEVTTATTQEKPPQNGPFQVPDEKVIKKRSSKKSPVTKSKSTGSAPELDDVSDPEESKRGFEVNYLETTTTLPRLKRSSGSVSFPQRIHRTNTISVTRGHPPVVIEENPVLMAELQPSEINGGGEMEQPDGVQEHTLQVTANSEEQQDLPNIKQISENNQEAMVASKPDNSNTEQLKTERAEGSNLGEGKNEKVSTIKQEPSPAFLNESEPTPPTLSQPTSPQPSSVAVTSSQLMVTPLPLSPITLEGDYIERSGWLTKLSHRKGMFGDKWQKRYFVLHRSWLYYFKKYGDSNPRGVIRLLPSGWSRPVSQGSLRMPDAVVTSNDKGPGIMSVLRCLAVHRPNNFAASLSNLLEADGVAEAFRSQTVSVSNPQHTSRTFYMTASSNNERDAWIKAINSNIQAYSHSAEALTTATKELKSMLRAVKSTTPPKDIPSLLLMLHTQRGKVVEKQAATCSHSHSH